MKKSSVYVIILLLWLLLIASFSIDLYQPIQKAFKTNPQTAFFVIIATIFVLYFWLNALKDIIYTLFFYVFKPVVPAAAAGKHSDPLVDIVYCTYNDFTEESLRLSMNQEYKNFKVIILDDSTDPEYMRKVDAFAKEYKIKVIRRGNREGFKAGNLNNYLLSSDAKYTVILDSDEVIPSDFIRNALPYFNDDAVGIVQGNHSSFSERNSFVKRFAEGIEPHWKTYQSIKSQYGFLSFLGHGAMIRMDTLKEVGGFPHLVAEDICLSIEFRNKGKFVVFAPEIMCFEEFPVSYLAFKKRHAKWTMGNMEFIQKYSWKLIRSNMHWYEKLDILLFTYNLPLAIIFIFYLVINIVILPVLHFSIDYPEILIVPTIIALIAPLMNDMIFLFTHKRRLIIPLYVISCIILYGSMFFISFRSSFRALFGKATFISTPKTTEKISVIQAISRNFTDILFAIGLAGISEFFLHSVFPVILIVAPTFASVYLTRLSNREERV